MSHTPRKLLHRLVPVLTVLAWLSNPASHAQFPKPPAHLSGLINDYTTSGVSGGPYEIRGKWSLDIDRSNFHELADFSAFMNMETSDYGITEGIVTPTDPTTRIPHTHHFSMTGATVSYDTSVCPPNSAGTPAATGPGIVITGDVSITANGGAATFESKGKTILQVCITGGAVVPLSNITLTLTGPATGHFGMTPIHGVVHK